MSQDMIQKDESEESQNIFQSMGFAGGTFISVALVDALGHLGPTGLVVGAIGSYFSYHYGPKCYAAAMRRYDTLDPQSKAAIQAAMSRFRHTPVEEIEEKPAQPKDDAMRVVDVSEDEDEILPIAWANDDEEAVPMPATRPGRFTFSQVLAKGFRPSLDRIYLGTLDNGTDVIVPVEDLCHVALAGLTGNGKGTIMRLIMSQLCSIGVRVLLLNPHYAGYDQSGGEDWTPFERKNRNGEPYLQQPPLPCSKEETIAMYLEWMAQTLIPQRKALAQEYKSIGRPYFVIVDEWPDVVKECEKKKINVVEHLEKILREGRKYGIYVALASQDFQVKTIGVESGGVRKCFKTVFYVGGDAATARALLGDTKDIRDNELGGGAVILRCKAVPEPKKARVPYVDNEALYLLLGPTLLDPSVFNLSSRKVEEIALPVIASVKSAQPVQALPDLSTLFDEEVESVSFEELCEAVAEMAMAGESDSRIMRHLDLIREEYIAIAKYIQSHLGEFQAVGRSAEKTSSRPNLSVVHREVPDLPGTSDAPRDMAVNEPTEQPGATSDRFVPREDDLLLSEVQGRLLEVWYQANHNVEESLKQIRNERGQGLGSRYNRHASYLLEQAGLKKRRA